MSWTKVEEMPCVLTIVHDAEKAIKEATGTDVHLHVVCINVSGDQTKEIVKDIVTRYFQVSWHAIESADRDPGIVIARHTYMYVMHCIYGYSKSEVANDCGGRDHTTAISAIRKIKGFYHVKDSAVDDIERVKKLLPKNIVHEKV